MGYPFKDSDLKRFPRFRAWDVDWIWLENQECPAYIQYACILSWILRNLYYDTIPTSRVSILLKFSVDSSILRTSK